MKHSDLPAQLVNNFGKVFSAVNAAMAKPLTQDQEKPRTTG